MTQVDLSQYRYQSIDNSLLTPHFKRLLVRPLFPLIPQWLPANLITLISSVWMLVAFLSTYLWGIGWHANYLLIPAMFFLYLLFDHFDGMQARATGTSSPLGEFCDHYLDILNDGIVLLVLLQMFRVGQYPWIGIGLVFSIFLGHAVIFYEQHHTGWLHFEPVSSTEAVFLVIFFMLMSYPTLTGQWLHHPIYMGYSPMQWVVIGCIVGGPLTMCKCLWRTGRITWQWGAYLASIGSMAWASFAVLPTWSVGLLALLYHADYIGGLMRGTLVTGREPTPDLIVPVGCLACLIHPSLAKGWPLFAMLAYIGIKACWVAVSAFLPLRQFWVWRNPPMEAQP